MTELFRERAGDRDWDPSDAPSVVRKPSESFRQFLDRVYDGDVIDYIRNHSENCEKAWRKFYKEKKEIRNGVKPPSNGGSGDGE